MGDGATRRRNTVVGSAEPTKPTGFFSSLLNGLMTVESVLDRIQQKMETTMAQLQNFKDLLAAVDAETTRISDKITDLVAQLAAGGMTDAQEAEVLAGLTAAADRLKTIGADPADPIPVEPPVV